MAWRAAAYIGAVLNMIDAVATCYELEAGLIVEANPIMAAAYEAGVPVFMAVKLVASALFFYLAYNKERPLAKAGIAAGTLTYISIATLHIAGLMA